MSKNIVHFAPAFASKGGGIFEVVHCLANEQCEFYGASNVKVIGCSDNIVSQVHDLPNGVLLDILPYSWNYIVFLRNFFKFYKVLKKSDILHVHGAWSLQFFLLLPFIVFNQSSRIVYQPHGLLSYIRFKKSKLLKKIFWHLVMKLIIRKSSIVISTSSIEEHEFIYGHEVSKKVKCVSNAIANDFFHRPLNTRLTNNFLFLSQIIPIKGLELLFHAFGRLIQEGQDVSLTIAGYGDPMYVQELRELVIDLDLGHSVNFIGPVNRDDRIEIYDAHKFFILPSKNESFGLVIGEALARGCVSFVSDRTPWTLDEDIPNLIMVQPDQNILYDTIKGYIEKDSQYSAIDAITSQHTIARRYSWIDRMKHLNILYFENENE